MRLFLTVGTQLPFDRLVAAADAWAAAHPEHAVLAQIAEGAVVPRHMEFVRTMPRDAFGDAVAGADVIIAHAGIGSLLTALDHGKPLVVMPRKAAFGEHRNDHQLATVREIVRFETVRVIHDAADLPAAIAAAGAEAGKRVADPVQAAASAPLLKAVADFIANAPAAGASARRAPALVSPLRSAFNG